MSISRGHGSSYLWFSIINLPSCDFIGLVCLVAMMDDWNGRYTFPTPVP